MGSEDLFPPVMGGHIRWMPFVSTGENDFHRLTPNQKPGPGGAGRDRTDDLRLAKPALSQLSYSPDVGSAEQRVGQGRVELPTSRLSGVRSNHLSYWPGWTRPGGLVARGRSPLADPPWGYSLPSRSLKTEPDCNASELLWLSETTWPS